MLRQIYNSKPLPGKVLRAYKKPEQEEPRKSLRPAFRCYSAAGADPFPTVHRPGSSSVPVATPFVLNSALSSCSRGTPLWTTPSRRTGSCLSRRLYSQAQRKASLPVIHSKPTIRGAVTACIPMPIQSPYACRECVDNYFPGVSHCAERRTGP